MTSPEIAPITHFRGCYCSHLEHLHVGFTEQNLPHRILGQKILGQKIMREAQFVGSETRSPLFPINL